MDQSKRKTAIILNAFVFPGVGHFSVGQKKKGIFIIFLTLLFFGIALFSYMSTLNAYLASFHLGKGAGEQIAVALSVSWHKTSRIILFSLICLVITWIYSIVDLLILKKK